MAVLLVWASGLLAYYPSGWEVYASPQEWATIALVSILFGLLVPLEVAAIAKARSAVASLSGLAGVLGRVLGISCCAPLLVPALLSFVGFSGTTLVSFNAAVSAYAAPFALASIVLMVGSIFLVSRTITAVCVPRSILK
jgi:hypothetical protein